MSRRHTRRIWILVMLVVVLGLAAIAETVRERRTAPKPLLALDSERIDEITIDCANCPSRRFQRVQGQWLMLQPWPIPADAQQIERLIQIAAAPMRRRFEIAQIDPAALGLVPPFATLTLGRHRVEFGTTDAINHARYVRVGQQVALVHDRVSVVLVAAPERFVDPDPFAGLRLENAVVLENDQPWPASRVAALWALRAEQVSVSQSPPVVRSLVVRDAAGIDHPFGLSREPSGALSLLRDAPALAYALPASAASVFAD